MLRKSPTGAIFNGLASLGDIIKLTPFYFPPGTKPPGKNRLKRNPLGMKAPWCELWDYCPWDEYAVNKCPSDETPRHERP